MERTILVGFGDAGLTKNGKAIYSESMIRDWDKAITVGQAEEMAARAPDNDWRIYFFAPLYEAEYQRQGDKHWVMVKRGDGFA